MNIVIIESAKGLLSLLNFEESSTESYIYILVGEVCSLKADFLEKRNLVRLSDTKKSAIKKLYQMLSMKYDLKNGLNLYTTDQTFNAVSASIINKMKTLSSKVYLLDHLKDDNLSIETKFCFRTYIRFLPVFVTNITSFRTIKFSNNALGYKIVIPGIKTLTLKKVTPQTLAKINAALIILLPLSFDTDIALEPFLNYLENVLSHPLLNIDSVVLKLHPRERISEKEYVMTYPNLSKCRMLDKNIPFELYSFENPLVVNLNSSFSNFYNLQVSSLYSFFAVNTSLSSSNVTGTLIQDLDSFKTEMIKKSNND